MATHINKNERSPIMPASVLTRSPARSLLLGIVTLLLLMTATNESRAQVSDEVREAAMRDYHGDDMTGKDGPLAKAGFDLLLLYHAHKSESSTVGAATAEGPGTGIAGIDVRQGRVTVDAVANKDVEVLKADLEALGMTRTATAGPMVSGRFPIENVPELARLEALRSVQVARPATQSASRPDVARAPRDADVVPSQRPRENRESPSAIDPKDTVDPERAEVNRADSVRDGMNDAGAASTSTDSGSPMLEEAPSVEQDTPDLNPGKTDTSGGGVVLIVLVATLVLFLDV